MATTGIGLRMRRPAGLVLSVHGPSVDEWVDNLLGQVERRALSVLKREGYEYSATKFSDLRRSTALPRGLDPAALHARSAIMNCERVRELEDRCDLKGAMLAAIRAVNDLWNAGGHPLRDNAIKGQAAKKAKDPKQQKKPKALRLIAAWRQQGLPEFDHWRTANGRRNSNAAFASFLCEKFGFESPAVIERWFRLR
jgi:hypothetical protein